VIRVGLLWAVLVGLALGAESARCQVSVGVQGDWGSDSSLGIGARVSGDLPRRLALTGFVDKYFPGNSYGADVSVWEAGVNLVYRMRGSGARVVPYAGLGLNYSRFSASVPFAGKRIQGDETLGGVDVLAGAAFSGARVSPFVEGRFTASNQSQIVISVGVRVGGRSAPGRVGSGEDGP
jgi:hypothetical protein